MSIHSKLIPKGELCNNNLDLNKLLPNSLVFEHDTFYSIVCVYPIKQKVLGFEQIYSDLKEKLGETLMPLYNLVTNGSVRSYFVVYVRKIKEEVVGE